MSDLANLIEAVQQERPDRVRAILDADSELVNQRDESAPRPFITRRSMDSAKGFDCCCSERGANINSTDDKFGATRLVTGNHYLREMGGFLGIELADLAYAIQTGDTRWLRGFSNGSPRSATQRHKRNPCQLALRSGIKKSLSCSDSNDPAS